MSIQAQSNGTVLAAEPEEGTAGATTGSRAAAPGLWTVVFLVWLLSFASYSPVRETPLGLGQLDPIGICKAAVRIVAVLLLVITYLRLPLDDIKRRTLRALFPLGLFAFWTLLSTAWSPLKSFSFGHAGELVMLLLLSVAAGIASKDDRDMRLLLIHCVAALLTISLLSVILAYFTGAVDYSPRTGIKQPRGFIHPNLTAQGAAAALVTVLAGNLIWNWGWAKKATLPAFFLAAYLLYAAHSRTAIALSLIHI